MDEVESGLLLAVEEIARVLMECGVERRRVPHQHGGAWPRSTKEFVRVPDQRIRQLDAVQPPPVTWAEKRACAVRTVDVEPKAVVPADPGNLAQRIEDTGRCAAGIGHQGERPLSIGACPFDHATDFRRDHAARRVDGQGVDIRLTDSQDSCGPGNGIMAIC